MIPYCARYSFFKPLQIKFLFLILVLMNSGCAAYKIKTNSFSLKENSNIEQECVKNHQNALNNPLYNLIPRHKSQLQWYDFGHWTTWMVFGNDDDGIFGEGTKACYRLNDRNDGYKALSWWCRNPLHNFCFYVIGTAYRKENSSFSIIELSDEGLIGFKYSPNGKKQFIGKKFGFYVVFHGGKPFISLRFLYHKKRHCEIYAGWRSRGNFGLKCLLFKKTKIKLIDKNL